MTSLSEVGEAITTKPTLNTNCGGNTWDEECTFIPESIPGNYKSSFNNSQTFPLLLASPPTVSLMFEIKYTKQDLL